MTEGFDESGNARKLVWACSCGKGGVAAQIGTAGAGADLERQAARHLRDRGAEGHRIDVGGFLGSLQVDPAPRPLLWQAGEP